MTELPRHDDESGLALVATLAFMLIISIFAVVVFATLQATQTASRDKRNLTTAIAAADAGAEEIIFELGYTGGTTPPWDDYVPDPGVDQSTCEDPIAAQAISGCNARTGTIGDAAYVATVTEDASESRVRYVNVAGEYPAGSGEFARIQVKVRQDAPAAFDYSMFADDNIKIHHHGSSFLAPRVTTNSVHSNADVYLDASSEFRVETFTAVGELKLANGVSKVGNHANLSTQAKLDGGDFGVEGYSWRYDIGNGNLCYPGAVAPVGTVNGNGCADMFSPNATIVGNVYAGTLTLTSRGNVKARTSSTTLATGVVIPPANGDVHVDDGSGADLNGTTVNGTPGQTFADCSGKCSQGASAGGGKIGGSVVITADPPTAIEFPSLDYETTYKPRAERAETNTCQAGEPCNRLDGGKQHVFGSDDAFFDYITTQSNGFYRRINPGGNHVPCMGAGEECDYVLLQGDYYVYGGISMDTGTIHDRAVAEGVTTEDHETMPLVVTGSLVTPDGGMDMSGRLYLAGRGNQPNFLYKDDDGRLQVDLSLFLSDSPDTGFSSVEPGVLAAGGSMKGSDDDTDSNWEDSGDLEISRINATWVRGLVYSGVWDDGDQRSYAEGQHWHNYDPKNSVRIYGSQVGGELHDCNTFQFTYDDVVANAFGFAGSGSGTIEVLRWDEIPTG